MGWRKTGEYRRAKTHEVVEMFCDVCGVSMPAYRYPRYELEIETCEYHYEGDAPDRFHICSAACLVKKADALMIVDDSSIRP